MARFSSVGLTAKIPVLNVSSHRLEVIVFVECGVCVALGFRHSVGFHARVVLDSDAFRLVVFGEVNNALGVLGLDRVVRIVRVLVSW